MSELAATAERLRAVKEACLDFITLWAIDRLMDEDRTSERIYGDVICCADESQKNWYSQSDRYLDD